MNKIEIMNEIEESIALRKEALSEIRAVMRRYEDQLETEMWTLSNMQMEIELDSYDEHKAYFDGLEIAINDCNEVYKWIVSNLTEIH